jgi:hypothetical protein
MAFSFKKFWAGITIVPKTTSTSDSQGDMEVLDSDGKLRYHNGATNSPVVTESHTATLINKTLTSPVINTGVSGTAIDTDGTLAANSDTLLASQKAVKTYVDTSSGVVQDDVDDLITLSGVPANSTDLGTFTGTTIPDGSDNKEAFQALETGLENHIADAVDAHDASAISVVPVGNLVATDAQAAFAELDSDIDMVGSDLQAHIVDPTDAHDASAISNVPAGTIAATDVQSAINELDGDIQAHITDAVDAHDASAISVTPSGNLGSTDVQSALVELQGDIDTINADIADDVEGPASATDEAIARFDGTTGKLIQNSVITATDAGVMSGITQLNVDNLRLDGNVISNTGGTNISLNPESTEAVIVNGNFVTTGYNAHTPTEDTSSGSGVTIGASSDKNIYLTNPALVSIDMIIAGPFGQEVTLINKTGVEITINNDTGATPEYRIYTGTGASVQLPVEGAFSFVYEGVSQRWSLIGGTGSGGGQSLDTIFQLTGSEIGQWSTGDNATFLGGGTLAGTFVADTSTPLQGLQSYLYTQAAGSLNDYLASPAQDIDLRFRGQEVTLYFPYTYDGSNNDIRVIFYDDTNNAEIPSSVYIQASTNVNIFKTNIVIPATCESIIVGFQVAVLDSGAIFEFDSLQLTSNTTVYVDTLDIATLRTTGTTDSSSGNYRSATIDSTISTSNYVKYFSISDDATNGTQFTVLQTCMVSASGIATRSTAQLGEIEVRKNGSVMNRNRDRFSTGGTLAVGASAQFTCVAGDIVTFNDGASDGTTSSVVVTLSVIGANENIVTAPETFSTDTADLTYAGSSTYTLSTLANAPVGTFITFTYAISTNTRTQTNAAAPTQTTSDMATNGIQLFPRAFNAASTSGSPTAIAIQIGKGMKGVTLNLYKSSGKTTGGSLDWCQTSTTNAEGFRHKNYEETTGILYLDCGVQGSSTTTAAFAFQDITSQSSGYLTINASKNPALTGLNINAVAVSVINTAGTSISNSGSDVDVVWDSAKIYDTHNAMVSATGIFTAPEAGYYQVSWGNWYASSAWTIANTAYSTLYKNGVAHKFGSLYLADRTASNSATTHGSAGVFLAKGDTLKLAINNNRTGGNTTLNTTAGTNFLTIHKTSVG